MVQTVTHGNIFSLTFCRIFTVLETIPITEQLDTKLMKNREWLASMRQRWDWRWYCGFGYLCLSLFCLWLGSVRTVPPKLDHAIGSLIPYMLLFLGPPVTLAGGTAGIGLYILESSIVIGLIWLCAGLFNKQSDALLPVAIFTAVFWIGCAFLSAAFVI